MGTAPDSHSKLELWPCATETLQSGRNHIKPAQFLSKKNAYRTLRGHPQTAKRLRKFRTTRNSKRQSSDQQQPVETSKYLLVLKRSMAQAHRLPMTLTPQDFIVEVGAELSPDILRARGRAVNALLRLAMLASMEMELDAAVNTFADFLAEIVPYDRIVTYFWDEEQDAPRVRLVRGLEGIDPNSYSQGNILNVWASRFAKPMLISMGEHPDSDSSLVAVQSGSALIVPITIGSRVMGSLQLFSRKPRKFQPEDAQLVWIFTLIAENQLGRGCANDGLLKFAFTDYLTGLRTRGYFEQQLELEIKRAERNGSLLALLMVDIDRFKLLNDQ